jgi:hypothetical protein
VLAAVSQKTRREHGRQRETHQHRHGDGETDGETELKEEPADDSAHERDGHEHGENARCGGQHGEKDFGCGVGGCGLGLFTELLVAMDVFDHDDGVVDQDADRQRERQHRHLVEREAQPVHERECRDHTRGQRHGTDERGSQIMQEEQNDQHREYGAED